MVPVLEAINAEKGERRLRQSEGEMKRNRRSLRHQEIGRSTEGGQSPSNLPASDLAVHGSSER
jgi:hypothetical protein